MPRITLSHRIRRAFRRRDSSIHPQSPYYKWWLLGNVMIGTFMAVLDSTIVNVGLPKIMASFGVGIDKIEWVLTAYMLALAVMLPASGWLADRFGYKRIYFYGIFLFTLGSFLCGISGDENMLIFSRVIQGLGGGFIMPLGMAIVTREFPPQQRGIALGFWSIAAAASVSFGPLIGGFLIDRFNWSLIFDVNVPVGIIGMVATILIQKEYKRPSVRRFDVVGFFSASIFLPCTLYALTESSATSNSAGWHSPVVLGCFAISIIAFVVFIATELTTKHPLIDLSLFRDSNFTISNIIMVIFSIGMFGSTFLLPLYLQNSLGYTAIQAGAVFLPVGIIQGILAPISGFVGDKTNPKIPILIGLGLLSSSFLLNSRFTYLTEHHYVMALLYLRGFGMGLMFTPLSAASMLKIPREKMAQASGMFNIIRQLGGSFGIAILSTLLTTRATFHTQVYAQSVDSHSESYYGVTTQLRYHILHDSGDNPGDALTVGQSLLASQVSKEAFIKGIDDDFLIAGIITLMGAIPIIFLQTRKKKPDPALAIAHPD